MKLGTIRSDARVLASALFASLGLAPSACGGQSVHTTGDDGSSTGGTAGESSGGTGGTAEPPAGGTGGTAEPPTGGTGGTGATNRFPCEYPVEIGAGTSGFVRCESGAKHRPSVETCFVSLPRPDELPPIPNAACASDLDCQERSYGHCGTSNTDGEVARYCQYGCATDADCTAGSICECGDFVGRCVSANCQSDSDCDAGFFCQTHDRMPGCSWEGYACQRPGDTCGSDADCPLSAKCSAGFEGTTERSCTPMTCTPGRPFLVAGTARTAPHARRADWRAGGSWPSISSIPPGVRERVGRFYADCAALEHASIAAFARFSLGLLAVGAPSDLVSECAHAMSDEIEHARVTYELASHFLGRPVGPGVLSIAGALENTTLDELALSTFVEGAIGETLGALEAREAAAHTRDPVLRAGLERIADDEARHAALAFRFVAWALDRSGANLRERLVTALETARRELDAASPDGERQGADELADYGVLSEATRRAVRREALDHAVRPCLAALLVRSAADRANYAFASA